VLAVESFHRSTAGAWLTFVAWPGGFTKILTARPLQHIAGKARHVAKLAAGGKVPFWSDVKKHIVGDADLSEMTDDRIRSNKNFTRLYPHLKDGVIDLLGAKLRWSNEPVHIVPKSVHGNLQFGDIGGIVRIRDALHARVRGEYARVVYPYFSEEPALPEEGGRLGLWAMQQALIEPDPNDMRVLRRTFFSPQTTPLRGNEGIVFRENFISIITEWERLKLD
jgi:hypothetical protein